MLVAMFPMIVHADEEPGSFTELQALVDGAGPYDTIMLDKDYVYKDTDTCGSIKINKRAMIMCGNYTIGGGKCIDRNLDALPADGDGHVFTVEAGGDLTLLNMFGGVSEIKGGYAENGGGILVEEGGSFTLYDGVVITGNTATEKGGGVYVAGEMRITDTTQASAATVDLNNALKGSDVYLASTGSIYAGGRTVFGDLLLAENTTLSLTSSLADGASIGISTESTLPYHVTTGCNITDLTTARAYFSSTQGTISLDNGEIMISGAQTISAGFSIENSLTIKKGIIGLNFLVYKGDLDDSDFASSKVEFKMDTRGHNKEKTVYTADAVKTEDSNGNECYKYSFEMSPLQFNEDVTATFSYGEGDNLVVVDDKTCSAMDYFNKCTDSSAPHFNVVYQLFNLGYYLQAYLGRENRWANEPDRYVQMPMFFAQIYGLTGFSEEGYSGILNTIQTTVPDHKATKSIAGTSVTGVSYALEFDSSTTLVVTFTLADDATGFEIPSESNNFNYTVSKYKKNNLNQYRVRISDIYAQDLDVSYDITGHCDGDENDFTVHVCPMGYVYSALNKSSTPEDKKKAMGAVYYFWSACENYCS